MTLAMRHADYGQRWGEGAARYFYIEGDILDEEQGMRLMPVPDSFFCPISAAIMTDPVSTVDGCAYEREYIERWFRERRQQRQTITSPATGLELLSTTLMPLVALQRAIEAYLAHRPELKENLRAGRSYEEAAQALQADLLEKQALNASVHDEMRRLREANRALRRALERSEERYGKVLDELLQLKGRTPEKKPPKEAASVSKVARSLTNPSVADSGGESQLKSGDKLSAQSETAAEGPVSTPSPETCPALQKDVARDIQSCQKVTSVAPASTEPSGGREPSAEAVADTQAEDLSAAPAATGNALVAACGVASGSTALPTADAANLAGCGVGDTLRSSLAAPVEEAAKPLSARESLPPTERPLDKPADAVKVAPARAPEELERSSAATSMEVARQDSASAARVEASDSSPSTTSCAEAAGKDPPCVARTEMSRPAKKDENPAASVSEEKASRASASVPSAGASLSSTRNECLKMAAVREPARTALSVASSYSSISSRKSQEQRKEAQHVLHCSSQRGSSSSGVVARPACLPAPLSSSAEKTSCSSSGSDTTHRTAAARSTSAILIGLALLLTVCIFALILQLQRIDPESGRIRQIRNIFGGPALLSPPLVRQAAATNQAHSLSIDLRSEQPAAASASTASTDSAASPEGTTLQVEEKSAGEPSDLAGSKREVLVIQGHVEKLRLGTLDEKVRSAAALEELALKGPAEQAAIARSGAVRLLVELVRAEGRPEVRGKGAAALGALVAGSSENQVIALRAGAISTTVKLLRAGIAPKVAAATLRNLATNNAKNQVAIVRAGAIAPLVELMTNGAPEARLEAAATLEDLAGDRSGTKLYDKQVAFVQAGAIPPLVRLLQDKASVLCRASASMLRMLATNNADNQVAIAQAGAIPPLVTLLTDTEAEVRKEAAAALGRLSFLETEANYGNQAGIGQAGAIPLLVALLQDPCLDVHATAAGTLRNLATGNAENQIRMLNAGVTQPLVAQLKSDDKAVQAAAMRLVRSLADNSAENQLAMARAGVLVRLLQLVKVPQIRGEAVGALASLARNSVENRVTIKQAGVNLEPHAGDLL